MLFCLKTLGGSCNDKANVDYVLGQQESSQGVLPTELTRCAGSGGSMRRMPRAWRGASPAWQA